MTVSKVTQTNLFAGVGTKMTAPGVGTDDFSRIFATQSAETENMSPDRPDEKVQQPDDGTNVETEKTPNEKTVNETAQDTEAKDAGAVEKTEENPSLKEDEADAKEMEEAVSELLMTIGQILGVSTEELQSKLQELGISPEELLAGEKIPQLVVAMTEGTDELSVMTDGELFSKVQEITGKARMLLQELADSMNLTPRELTGMIQDMAKANTVSREELIKTVVTENTPEIPVLEEVRVQTPIERPNQSRTGDEGRQGADTAGQQMTFSQTVAKQIEQAVAKVETSYSTQATTESIMDQIQDAIRVIQRQDMTEMELQLHPASLGQVRVRLTAAEGVLTATFTAENETVKAALEAQMLTLKQSFETQGIKVEAVEVTVASHAFEHNLNGDEKGGDAREMPEKKKSGRRISLSELLNAGDEEELSDEDRIVAEMMKENGNTVDYMV